MRSLLIVGMLVALSTATTATVAQLTPSSVQMHGQAHATVTPPIGPPQAQMDVDDLATLGEVGAFASIGQVDSGPYSSAGGNAAVKVFGGGYRFASISSAFGRGLGNASNSDGEADASFIFNIDQACTMQLAMQFRIIGATTTATGGASTFFEFYGPGDSLLYSMHLNQPTGPTILIDQSFDLLPGQYRMESQSLADIHVPSSVNVLDNWISLAVVDITIPAPGCWPLLGCAAMTIRRRRRK